MWNTFEAARDRLARQYKEDRWDAESGLAPQQLRETLAGRYSPDTHNASEAKSGILAFLLHHAQVEIHPDEFFADKLCHDDITAELMRPWQQAVAAQMDAVAAPYAGLLQSDAVFAGTDFGHLAPDWRIVIGEGNRVQR